MFIQWKASLGVTIFLVLIIFVKFSFPSATNFRIWTDYLQVSDFLLSRIIRLILLIILKGVSACAYGRNIKS